MKISYFFLLFTLSLSASNKLPEIIIAIQANAELSVITQLLDDGASPNARYSHVRYSALHCAIAQKRIDIAQLLLERGADPHVKSEIDLEEDKKFSRQYKKLVKKYDNNKKRTVVDVRYSSKL